MGGSLGLTAAGLYYLAHYFKGWPWGWEVGVSIWLMVFGLVPGLSWLRYLPAWVAGLVGAFARGWLATDDDQPGDAEPTPDPLPRQLLVGGYQLDEFQQHIWDGLLRLFQHAAAADSLTSTALIGPAFSGTEHWGYWTNLAAASGLCVKANGVTTVLPKGRTYAWAVAEIRKGNILWPADDGGPAPQPLPYPFRAGLAYKDNVEKVEKGGYKVDEDD